MDVFLTVFFMAEETSAPAKSSYFAKKVVQNLIWPGHIVPTVDKNKLDVRRATSAEAASVELQPPKQFPMKPRQVRHQQYDQDTAEHVAQIAAAKELAAAAHVQAQFDEAFSWEEKKIILARSVDTDLVAEFEQAGRLQRVD